MSTKSTEDTGYERIDAHEPHCLETTTSEPVQDHARNETILCSSKSKEDKGSERIGAHELHCLE